MPVRFIDLKYFQINAKEEAKEFHSTSIYFLGFFGIFVLRCLRSFVSFGIENRAAYGIYVTR